MLDPNLENNISKAYAKLGDIGYSIALNMRKGKDHLPSQRALKKQGISMSLLLKVLNRHVTFSPTGVPTLWLGITEDQVNRFIRLLIQLGELDQYPAVPSIFNNLKPVIITTGAKGDKGDDGDTGPQGPTGFATDFQAGGLTSLTVVDEFAISNAKGGKWEYVVTSGVNQRWGTVGASWLADGSVIKALDNSTEDIGDTTGIEFSVVFSGGNIQLKTVISSGTWTVAGSRFYTPSNGNGSGPVSGVLADGNIYVGNSSNQAIARPVSGAISITNTGVVSLVAGGISDSHINAGAAISLSKLAALTFTKLVVSDGAGYLTTVNVTPIEAGYLAGVTSNIQTQLNSKLSAATGAISPWTSANFGTNNVVAISDGSGKLAVLTTVTTTILGYLTNITSDVQTQLNAKQPLISGSLVTVPAGSPTLNYKVINIGDWDMDTVDYVSIAHGLNHKKIRSIDVVVRNDADTYTYLLRGLFDFTTGALTSGYFYFDATYVNLYRLAISIFNDSTYSTTGGYNRGYITILYES